jgi:hypothetical protein
MVRTPDSGASRREFDPRHYIGIGDEEGRKEYYIQRPATRAEEDGSTMKDPYLAN